MNFGPYLGGIESWSPNIGALILWTVVGVIHTLGPPTRPRWPRPVTAWSLSLTESSFFATSDWDFFFFVPFFSRLVCVQSLHSQTRLCPCRPPQRAGAKNQEKHESRGRSPNHLCASATGALMPSCPHHPSHPSSTFHFSIFSIFFLI